MRITNTPLKEKKKKRKGSYTITQVYYNGTIRMQRGSIVYLYERINTIKRLTPYSEIHKVTN